METISSSVLIVAVSWWTESVEIGCIKGAQNIICTLRYEEREVSSLSNQHQRSLSSTCNYVIKMHNCRIFALEHLICLLSGLQVHLQISDVFSHVREA